MSVEQLPVNTYQKRDAFHDFMEHVDEKFERRKPTPEEKEQMDANLVNLGKLFADSEIRWHLDGAMNISLLSNEYIGIHKDFDISIEEKDLEKLDQKMKEKGYGLFLTHPTNPKNPQSQYVYERVGGKNFLQGRKGELMLCAVDEKGNIREQNEVPLNFIDIHPIRRNEKNEPLGWSNTPIPKEWAEAIPKMFQGQEIHLSHPAKVAYFKIHQGRPYDLTDLRALAMTKALSTHDVEQIEKAIEVENIVRRVVMNIQTKRKQNIRQLKGWISDNK